MNTDGGPRNGDYVAYIEALSRRGAGPGQTLQELDSGTSWREGPSRDAERGGAPVPGRIPSDPPRGWQDMPARIDAPGAYPDAGSGPAPYTPYTPPPRAAGNTARRDAAAMETDADAGATLASQQQGRRVSIGMLAVGAVIGLVGINMALTGLFTEGGDPIPGLFLLFFAAIFMRGAWKQRRKSAAPLAKLPPLSTVSSSRSRRP